VLAVDVRGDDFNVMAARANIVAAHALRVLRIALRAHVDIANTQLRFRLSGSYAFGDRAAGWRRPPDAADDLGLDEDLIKLAMSQPVAAMPTEPITRIQKQADLALRWIERAMFDGEALVGLLYLFFALEALLGDSADKLKGHALAFRQTMLSHLVTGGFSHPTTTFLLYDQVRSGAVHGENPPAVSWNTTHRFGALVRQTLNEYLTYAKAEGLTRRSGLVRALERHPDVPSVVTWLRENGGSEWTPFLDRLDGKFRPDG
jgi:hypothetical protein